MNIYDKLKDEVIKYPDGYSIEIEAEFSGGCDIRTSAFVVKNDGSLMNFGLEFVSKTPKSKEDLIRDVKNLLSKPPFNRDYIETERTSTHIHYNVQNWTNNELFTFLAVYYSIEGVLFKYVGKSRISNLFCLPLYDAEYSDELFLNLYKQDYRSIRRRFETYKYAALNIASVARLGTIEFRHMYGTKNPEQIWEWLEVLDQIINVSKSFKSPEEVFDEFNRDREGLLRRILGRFTTRLWCRDWWELMDLNYSKMFNITNIKEEAKKELKKVTYKFKTELEFDDLKYNQYV